MGMTVPLPVEGDTSWYDWATDIHSVADAAVTPAQAAAAYQPLDADLTALAAAGNSGVLAGTTASFTTADETKLDAIEASADVTDATNVAAAGALMAASVPVTITVAISDETTALTTGLAKATFRMPHAMTLTAVRASLTTASTSGLVTFDINESNTSILSTLLTIDQDEKTSTTALTAAAISDSALADDAEITIDIDGAGTGAAGAKITLIGTRSV